MGTAGESEGKQQQATSRISHCEWPTHLPVDGTGVRSKGGGRRENGSVTVVVLQGTRVSSGDASESGSGSGGGNRTGR